MQVSHHATQRMSHRGISRRLLNFALQHGRIEGDKRILDRNESRRLLEELNEQLRLVKRILDKGGITVIADGDAIITTYNVDQRGRSTRAAKTFDVERPSDATRNSVRAEPVEAFRSHCADLDGFSGHH